MISHTTRRFFVIALLFATATAAGPAAFADDAAGRTFAFCDKNKDGKLDAGELESIPVSLRDWLAANGPRSESGLTQADFFRVYPKMMADLRKKSQVASAGGTSDAADSGSTDTQPPSTTKTANPEKTKPALYASTPPSDEVVESPRTTNLPTSYGDADLDKDGQIDYFEWRKAKLGDFAKFQELDLNNDSVLSAQELSAGGAPAGGSTSASVPATSSAPANSTGDPKADPSKTTSAPIAPSGPSEAYLTQVKFYFEIMDKQKGNGNGKLDPPEWNASNRIKPAFVKAGIDITKPMDEKTFIAHYSKVFPEPAKAKSTTVPVRGPASYSKRAGTPGAKPGLNTPRRRRR